MTTMPAARFRLATDADANALARFAEQTFRDTYTRFNTPEDMDAHCSQSFGQRIQLAEIRDAKRESWLVEIDGELAAFAQLNLDKACPALPGRSGVEILRFYVAAAHHGKGLAHQLMHELVARAEARAAEVLWLCVWDGNPRAAAFYRKSRFENVGTTTFQLGNETQRDWIMSRALRGR